MNLAQQGLFRGLVVALVLRRCVRVVGVGTCLCLKKFPVTHQQLPLGLVFSALFPVTLGAGGGALPRSTNFCGPTGDEWLACTAPVDSHRHSGCALT